MGMMVVRRHLRERIILRVESPEGLKGQESTPTNELDIKTLQALAEIGRTVVSNPIEIVMLDFEPKRAAFGFKNIHRVYKVDHPVGTV